MTSVGDVKPHVTDDVGESRTAVDSSSDSDSESDSQQTMTSTTSRHATLNSNVRSPSRTLDVTSQSPIRSLHVVTSSQGDRVTNLRQTSPTPRTSESYLGNARTQKNLEDRAGRVDCSVEDLEKMLSQIEASERQAWSWLEALEEAEKSDRGGDLRHYITWR